jgi:hypothetical protein
MGIIGTGIGGISSSVIQKLSIEFTNDMEWVTPSIEALQDEVDSCISSASK